MVDFSSLITCSAEIQSNLEVTSPLPKTVGMPVTSIILSPLGLLAEGGIATKSIQMPIASILFNGNGHEVEGGVGVLRDFSATVSAISEASTTTIQRTFDIKVDIEAKSQVTARRYIPAVINLPIASFIVDTQLVNVTNVKYLSANVEVSSLVDVEFTPYTMFNGVEIDAETTTLSTLNRISGVQASMDSEANVQITGVQRTVSVQPSSTVTFTTTSTLDVAKNFSATVSAKSAGMVGLFFRPVVQSESEVSASFAVSRPLSGIVQSASNAEASIERTVGEKTEVVSSVAGNVNSSTVYRPFSASVEAKSAVYVGMFLKPMVEASSTVSARFGVVRSVSPEVNASATVNVSQGSVLSFKSNVSVESRAETNVGIVRSISSAVEAYSQGMVGLFLEAPNITADSEVEATFNRFVSFESHINAESIIGAATNYRIKNFSATVDAISTSSATFDIVKVFSVDIDVESLVRARLLYDYEIGQDEDNRCLPRPLTRSLVRSLARHLTCGR